MNMLLLWLQETLNRLFIKQPKYFRYWTYFSYLIMIVSGIPYAIAQFNITLPEPFATLSNKAVTFAGVMMFWMSKLVIKTPQVGATTEGQAIQVTSKEQMPFTSKTEAKDIETSQPPVEVIPEVPEKPEEKKD